MHKKYALIGTGSRAEMFITALVTQYRDVASLVALCDLSQTRMDWYNRLLRDNYQANPVPTYHASQFEQMLTETQPDVVIVTTPDATHHEYIVKAMLHDCDVISEKPMTTDVQKAEAIFEAIQKTGRKLTVTFNYRYAPAYTQLRRVVMEGEIGQPLGVDFSWMLDVRHGADYFRRWHREKHISGGLLVHKATHHFDLVNWWIESYPKEVMAIGELKFYGEENAAARGDYYGYDRYTGSPEAQNDPFALFLDSDEKMRGLYLEAEDESSYIRDRNVFGANITIEDTMSVSARYQNGVILSYSLIAYSPWEGMRVAITGTKGRAELEIIETTDWLGGNQTKGKAAGLFRSSKLRVHPFFAPHYEVEIPQGKGGHGGGDIVLLEQLFSPSPPADPYNRAASHIDGAASIMLGIAANRSLETHSAVRIEDLFPLPSREPVRG
jgi:predicted dehydrogenase